MKINGDSSFDYVKDGDYSRSFGTPEYVAYVISHLTEQDKKYGGCLDEAWEKSLELADKFIGSEYDVKTKGLWECIADFLTSL